jgi:hypothetical protein
MYNLDYQHNRVQTKLKQSETTVKPHVRGRAAARDPLPCRADGRVDVKLLITDDGVDHTLAAEVEPAGLRVVRA